MSPTTLVMHIAYYITVCLSPDLETDIKLIGTSILKQYLVKTTTTRQVIASLI